MQREEPRAPGLAAAVYRRRGIGALGPLALAGGVLAAVAVVALTQGAAAIPPGTALGFCCWSGCRSWTWVSPPRRRGSGS